MEYNDNLICYFFWCGAGGAREYVGGGSGEVVAVEKPPRVYVVGTLTYCRPRPLLSIP